MRLRPFHCLFCAGLTLTAGTAFAQQQDDGAVLRPGQQVETVRQTPGQFSRQQAQRLNNPLTAGDPPLERAQVQATGGLRPLAEEEAPGSRFFSASETRARELEAARAEDLQRFALPDDQLITGSIDAEEDELPADLRSQALDAVDPWAPIGIRNGPLTWFPAIDLAIGYDSNTDRAANNTRQVRTVRLTPRLSVESDWVRHAMTANLRGTLNYVDDGRDLERSLQTDAELRLDLGLDTIARLRAGYSLTGEVASDPDAVAGADGSTDTHEITAGASVERTIGFVDASVGVDVSRALFSDTDLTGGGVQDNGDRNRTEGTLTLRLERADGPIYRPFAEASATLRRFDDDVDRNGFNRDSFGYGLRGGFVIAENRPLRGEVSLGLVGERFDDAALDDVLTVSAQAGLIWDVTALSTVTLDLETSLDPTTQNGSGVGINRSAALGLSHDLRRNVELRIGAAFDQASFSGIDDDSHTFTGTAGLTWRTSPVAAFTLDATYEHEPDSDGDVDRLVLEAGVTLQR